MNEGPFTPTHYHQCGSRKVYAQVLHKAVWRIGATFKREAICYTDKNGEITTRAAEEFHDKFKPIE
jgi:hypothetical protein